MQVYKLTKDKIELGNSYVILTTLLVIELNALGKVIEVKTICSTNTEISFEDATDSVKDLPLRFSKELNKSEFDELVELYKNDIKGFQSY